MRAMQVGAAGLMLGLMVAGCASSGGNGGAKTADFAGLEVVTFPVDGMACENCAKHIAEELGEVPGVKVATVDFASKTAKVGMDPAKPASMEALEAAVSQWKKEHFSAKEDPECLDPAKREEIKRGG